MATINRQPLRSDLLTWWQSITLRRLCAVQVETWWKPTNTCHPPYIENLQNLHKTTQHCTQYFITELVQQLHSHF